LSDTFRGYRLYLSVRSAALLPACDGRVPMSELTSIARRHGFEGSLGRDAVGKNKGSVARLAVYRAMRALREEGSVVRDGEDWLALDLPALATWIADRVDDDYAPVPLRASSGVGR
jgi:hypothetical protein